MTSAQASDDVGATIEPTSTMPISIRLYHYANLQTDPGMFFIQNWWGLIRQILRPLWIMTSAAAVDISVLSVK